MRCESTTPFGRPVLPLVKKMTCGSRSSRPSVVIGGRSGPGSGITGEKGMPAAAASSVAAVVCDAPASRMRGGAVLRNRYELGHRRSRVQRGEDRTELGERREHRHRLERRVAPPEHAVAPPDRQVAQAGRDALRPRLDLAEGQLFVVERCRDRAGRDTAAVREHLADQEHRRSIARRSLARVATWLSTIVVDNVRMS